MKLICIVLPLVLCGCGSMPRSNPYRLDKTSPEYQEVRKRALEDNRKEAERQVEKQAEYRRWDEQMRAQQAQQEVAKAVVRAEARAEAEALPREKAGAWLAGEPVPGLPDLAKRVYIMPGTLICNSGGALVGATTSGNGQWLVTGYCSIIKTKMEVKVFPPANPEAQMEGSIHRFVLVGRRSDKISDGRLFTGWVKIYRLTN